MKILYNRASGTSNILIKAFIVILFLVGLLYSNTLTDFFLDDEHGFFVRPFFSECNRSISCFLSRFWEPPAPAVGGIPIFIFYFVWACIGKAAGLNAAYYHITSVFMHACVTYIFFLYIRRLSASRRLSVYAAILFAVSYVASETVARIIHMQYLLCAVFFLLSLLLSSYSKPVYRALSFLSFLLALMCKEIAVVIPPLIVTSDIIFKGRKEVVKGLGGYAPFFIVVTAFSAMKFYYAHTFGSIGYMTEGRLPYQVFFQEHGFIGGVWIYLQRLIALPAKYIVLSVNRFVFGDYTFFIKRLLGPLFCLPIGLYAAIGIRRFLSDRVVIFSIIFSFLALLPVVHLLDTIDYNNGGLINTRYLYFAAMGFYLLFARSLAGLADFKNRLLSVFAKVVFCLSILIFSIVLYGNNSAYREAAEVVGQIPLQTKAGFPLFKGKDTKFYFINTDNELFYEKGVHLFKNGGLDGAFFMVYGFYPEVYIVDKREYEERICKFKSAPPNLLPRIDLQQALGDGYVLRWDPKRRRVTDAAGDYKP